LLDSEATLNYLDSKVGDGDTGFTFANGARAIKQDLVANKLPLNHLDSLFSAIAQILESAMGGSSGVLLSILFTRAGAAIGEVNDWPRAIESGIDKMMELGGAKKDGRTMLNPLYRAVKKLKLKESDLAGAAREARIGADLTKDMTKSEGGRSAYLNEDTLKGNIDPGAETIALVFEHLSKTIDTTSDR